MPIPFQHDLFDDAGEGDHDAGATAPRRPVGDATPQPPVDVAPPPGREAAPPAASPAGSSGNVLLSIPGPAASLSKAQKEFNRLNAGLERLRGHLAAWQAAADALEKRRGTEQVPLERKLLATQRATVLWIDAHLQDPPPGERQTKSGRAKLVALIRLLARAVLDAGPDAEVEAAHDRHSARSHREQQRDEVDRLAATLGEAFGDAAPFEGEAASVDDLLRRARQRLDEQDRREADPSVDPPPPASPGGRPSAAERARLRDARALQEASQSVRDVYRRLARDLHPDREADPGQRERKTALMARANGAYAANDLLALLAMQLELEQIDADHLAGVPDTRLRHYNRVLQAQQRTLEAELEALQMPVAAMLDRPPGRLAWAPTLLAAVFDDGLAALRAALRSITDDTALLRDARTRAAVLRGLEVEDPDDPGGPFDAEPAPKRRRGRGRR